MRSRAATGELTVRRPGVGLIFLPWVLALLIGWTPAAAAPPVVGSWKLVRTEQLKVTAKRVEPILPGRTRVFTVEKNISGLCVGSSAIHDEAHIGGGGIHGKSSFEIRWKPPPAVIEVGKVWKPEEKIDATGAGHGAARLSTHAVFVSDPEADVETHLDGLGSGWSGGFRSDTPPRGEDRHLLVMVGVGASDGTSVGGVGNMYGDLDAFVYRYRWVGPRKLSGLLKLRSKPTLGGAAQGVSFRIRNLATGTLTDLSTDREGKAEKTFEAEILEDEFELEIEEVRIGTGTSLLPGGSPASPPAKLQGAPLVLPVKKRVTLRHQQVTSFDHKLPVFRLVLIAYRWDEARREWLGTPATVHLDQGDSMRFQVTKNSFRIDGTKYVAEVLLPTAEALGVSKLRAVGVEPRDKLSGSRSFTVPGAAAASVPVVVILNFSDTWVQLRRFQQRMNEFLSDPAFRDLVTPEAARAIASMRFVIDLEAKVPIQTQDGTATFNSEIFLQFTEAENNDTLFHEWTHHLIQVMADDPEIEDRLGGRHPGGFFQLNATPEQAWDEGRAHFCSTLFNLAFDNPNNSHQLTPSAGTRWIKDNAAVTTPGNRNEGIVSTALLEYYRKAGFRSTRNILAEFLRVHQFARSQRDVGHPPRTAAEFFVLLKRYNTETQGASAAARNKAVEALSTKFGISVPP